MSQIEKHLRVRLDEGEAIARKLYETLLPSTPSLIYSIQRRAEAIDTGSSLRVRMKSALDSSESLLNEMCDRVTSLRTARNEFDVEAMVRRAAVGPRVRQRVSPWFARVTRNPYAPARKRCTYIARGADQCAPARQRHLGGNPGDSKIDPKLPDATGRLREVNSEANRWRCYSSSSGILDTCKQPRAKCFKNPEGHPISGWHLSQRMAGSRKYPECEVFVSGFGKSVSHV